MSLKENLYLKIINFFLQVHQFENKINYLAKNKIDVKSLIENHKDFIIKNRLVLKSQQRFQREIHNVFTEEINKIVLNTLYTDDIRIQSIDSVETYAYGTKKISNT